MTPGELSDLAAQVLRLRPSVTEALAGNREQIFWPAPIKPTGILGRGYPTNALIYAIWFGSEEIATRILTASQADIIDDLRSQSPAIILAAEKALHTILELLFSRNFDPTIPDPWFHRSYVHHLSMNDYDTEQTVAAIQAYCKAFGLEQTLLQGDHLGRTPFFLAVLFGQYELAHALFTLAPHAALTLAFTFESSPESLPKNPALGFHPRLDWVFTQFTVPRALIFGTGVELVYQRMCRAANTQSDALATLWAAICHDRSVHRQPRKATDPLTDIMLTNIERAEKLNMPVYQFERFIRSRELWTDIERLPSPTFPRKIPSPPPSPATPTFSPLTSPESSPEPQMPLSLAELSAPPSAPDLWELVAPVGSFGQLSPLLTAMSDIDSPLDPRIDRDWTESPELTP